MKKKASKILLTVLTLTAISIPTYASNQMPTKFNATTIQDIRPACSSCRFRIHGLSFLSVCQSCCRYYKCGGQYSKDFGRAKREMSFFIF